MAEKDYLSSEELRSSRKNSLRRNRIFLNVVTYISAGIAVLSFIGLLVAVILLNFRQDDAVLYYILTGAFAGGGAIFALIAYGIAHLEHRAFERETDFKELCAGENCFYVGDGTLARLEERQIVVYSEDGKKKEEIRVPYSEMRFFSVCNRRRPKNKGEWSVVLEIPAHYLAKAGKGNKNDPPALVQADGKKRLYALLEKLGLTLLGEPPARCDGKKYTRTKKYKLPNAQKRRRAIVWLGVGAALTVLGVVLPIVLKNEVLAVLAAVGLVVAGRAIYSYMNAHATLAFYQEGMYFAESGGANSSFLTWEEIERVTREEKKSLSVLNVKCAYGSYYFPDTADAYDYLCEKFPQKCGGKHA